MRGIFYVFILWIIAPSLSAAQGSLVMIGGGSEAIGGWSDEPYQWIVDHAANKRVAVISYADEDNWIPDYFISLGASVATNIKISSRSVADLQSTYDNLMTYDAFFFKGGDQSIYYKQYKGTRTFQAAIDKFNAGGVMAGTSAGMAILSGVVYTAENDSAYPDETLSNIYDKRITLANDFFPFLPGYLADSHFTERGRVGRLLPFLARWYYDRSDHIAGIGVDDRTALCIDVDRRGEVFGTGTVSFYRAASWSIVRDEIPVTPSVNSVQLLHGHVIDLNTSHILKGPEPFVEPVPSTETGNYAVVISGSSDVNENTSLLNFLVGETGVASDTIVVVTSSGKGKLFAQKLVDLGARIALIETIPAFNEANRMDLRNTIRRTAKFLFAENNDEALFSFLDGGPTGALLRSHIRRNGMTIAFAGEDGRYAGKTFPSNYRMDKYAAYYGRLTFRKGLSLLSTTVIMPNTFDPLTSDFTENATAAISYSMVSDSARFGIYLNRKNMIRFYQQRGHNYFKATGNQSVLILMNQGARAARASRPVSNGGAARNYAGFNFMEYVMLSGDAVLDAGIPFIISDVAEDFEYPILSVEHEINQSSLQIFPNPSTDGRFHFFGNPQLSGEIELTITDSMGRIVCVQRAGSPTDVVDISCLPDGLYFLRAVDGSATRIFKLIKESD
ncbi:MAG: T9SS type A sorting domain-containing protein [Chryseolinea sp.]